MEMPIFTESRLNRKIPMGLPNTRAKATAPITGTSTPPSLISTPALLRANSGMIKKFTQGTRGLNKRSCMEMLSRAPCLSMVNTSYCSLRSFVSPESLPPMLPANWASLPLARTAFAGTERPSNTPAMVGCTPLLTKNAQTATPITTNSSILRTPMRKNTLIRASRAKPKPRAAKSIPSPLG